MEQYKIDKRNQILALLDKKAKAFNIKVDYVFDEENHREYLVCDDTNICCSHNSISAVFEEFVAYLFLGYYNRSLGAFEKQVTNQIKSYWYDKDFKQPFNKRR